MKKVLLFLSFLLVSVGVWGATSTITFLQSCNGSGTADDGVIWSITSDAAESVFDANRGIHYGTNSVAVSYLTLTTSQINGTIIKIRVNASGASKTSAKLNITVGGNDFGTQQNLSSTATTYTFNGSAAGTIIVSLTQSSATKALYCKSIEITYTPSTTYTVSFINMLGKNPNDINQGSQGGSISLPTNIDICNKCYTNNWNFEGWIESLENYEHIYTTTYTPSNNITLYALFSRGQENVYIDEYRLVTENLDNWVGNYLIAYHSTMFADGRIGGTGTGAIGAQNTAVNPGSKLHGEVVDIDWGDLYNVTLEEISEGSNTYVLKTKDGKYNYQASNNNGCNPTNNKNTAASYPITVNFISSSNIALALGGSATGAVFHYNTDGYFRYYKNGGQQPVYLYKRVKTLYPYATEYSTSPECDYDYISKWSTNSITLPEADLTDVTNPSNITIKNINSDNTILNRTSLSSTNGEYNITVSNLTNNSCDKINILVEGTDSMYLIYKVPIIVSSNVNTQASIFTSETECATCDVVVLDNKTLTVSGTTSQNRDVKVYSGGTLSVPSGTSYTINSLSLRKTDNISSYLSLYGNLNLSGDSSLFLDIYTDPSDWRWLALPDAFKAKDVIKSNGKKPIFGTDYLIKTYDGNKRAIEQRNGWTSIAASKVFAAGEGFIFGIAGEGTIKQEYRFKFANTALDREKANKTLSWETLKAWGCTTEGLAPNHIGWNLIGNPYFTTINTEIYSPIRIGHLIKDPSGDTWNGTWIIDPDETEARLRYRVVKCAPELSDDGSYRSELLDDIYLEPFECFFVQLGGNNTNPQSITLDVNKRRSVVSRYHEDTNEELFLRVYVDDAKTGMFISNKFTDEYEPGDDFESRRNIYQLINGYKLLYSAINDSIIENGVHIYSAGGKVTLDNKVKKEKFAEIYILADDSWYDLLHGDEPEVNGDFMLYAKRKSSDIPTEIDCIIDDEQYMIYDILGRRSKTSMHGIYIFKNEKSTMKIVR